MSGQVRRRGYTFAQLPEWILFHPDLSDRAVRLFAVLDRFAGDSTDCWPSRAKLAERMGCTVDTIDRAKAELVKAGAIEVEHRTVCKPGGKPRHTSNLYVLVGTPPEQGGRTDAATSGGTPAATGGRESAAGGGRTDAAQNESHPEREPVERDADASSVDHDHRAAGRSSSNERLDPHWEIWLAFGRIALDERAAPPDDPTAYVTGAARRGRREKRGLLAELLEVRPNAPVEDLARWLYEDLDPLLFATDDLADVDL